MGCRGNDPIEDASESPEERILEPEDMLMPVYEWKCNQCGLEFEKLKPMDKFDEDEYCPKCGYVAMPLVSAPSKAVITEAFHPDSGIPQSVHNHLTNKPHELYDRNLTRQGKLIEPEDM